MINNKRLTANILSALIMGFLYGYFDYHIQATTNYLFMGALFPWFVMVGMFVLPNVLIHYRHAFVGMANASLALSIEDLAYWFWAKTLPASWAWFYPVAWHIPIDDVIGIILAALLYYYGERYRTSWELRHR